MPSIESSGLPLVFEVANPPAELPGGVPAVTDGVSLRTVVRALAGMQKEATVTIQPTGTTWRLVSDEGPYLNGTDLAPFPLAFFAAGMQFCLLSELLVAADRHHVTFQSIDLELHNRYSMEGSFLRGDAHAGAFPPELNLTLESDAAAELVARVVAEAVRRCPAQALVTEILTNTFTLRINDVDAEVGDLPRSVRSSRNWRPPRWWRGSRAERGAASGPSRSGPSTSTVVAAGSTACEPNAT